VPQRVARARPAATMTLFVAATAAEAWHTAPHRRPRPLVTVELVYDPARAPSTSAPASTTSSFRSSRWTRPWPILPFSRSRAEPSALPAGPDGPRTSWITDPDGYRIELVQWPAGHSDGITEVDFA
jgi:lactoylglutathione lyase